MNFLCITILLILWIFCFSISQIFIYFPLAKIKTPIIVLGSFTLGIHGYWKTMECRIKQTNMNSEFKLALWTYSINWSSLFVHSPSVFLHISILLIHFTPKRPNTAVFMYKRTSPLKYTILEGHKTSYQSRNKQVNVVFLIIHLLSSRKTENKSTTKTLNKAIIEV